MLCSLRRASFVRLRCGGGSAPVSVFSESKARKLFILAKTHYNSTPDCRCCLRSFYHPEALKSRFVLVLVVAGVACLPSDATPWNYGPQENVYTTEHKIGTSMRTTIYHQVPIKRKLHPFLHFSYFTLTSDVADAILIWNWHFNSISFQFLLVIAQIESK